MKLFGSKSTPKHSGTNGQAASNSAHGSATMTERRKSGRHLSAADLRKRKITRIIFIIVLALAAAALAAVAIWKTFVIPPDFSGTRNPPVAVTDNSSHEGNDEPDDLVSQQPSEGRGDGKYTFALFGTDDGNGNTDTIMIASFDTLNYTMDIVSIPRDTMVNVSWSTKKINSLYGAGGVERSMSGLADILGFGLDFYVLVDLKAFEKLIDEIGGVYYNVPIDMEYNDDAQDLFINIKKGEQYVLGKDAVKIMRFRSGYLNRDIGRIGTQQDFLKTAAHQIVENKNKINLSTLANVFLNYVDTDLTYGNIIWFAQQFFKMDMENLNFHMMPGNLNDYAYHGGRSVSYVTIYVEEWLDLINKYLNPFNEDMTLTELNILTKNPSTGKIYSTSGVYAGNPSWGNSPPPKATPDPTPTPTPTPTPEPSPGTVNDPEPSPSADEEPLPTPTGSVTETPPDTTSGDGDASTGTEPEE